MASLALYRKWRSQTFDEIIGQPHVTQTLVNALKLNRVAHAYLFAGPRGTGKTSSARLLAKAVNCLAEAGHERPCNKCRICVAVNEGRLLDLIEIDAASNTGVDDIRDLRDKVGFRPGEAQIKFYIIDESHMLSNSAFNALLKTLEEPPEHVIFILATTEPEKIPATISSRCQQFDFKRIKLNDIARRLAYIVAEEGLTAETPALEYIARQGNGSMRDAISLLDQLTAYGQETITLELVQTVLGVVASQAVTELVEVLINQDVASGLDIINRVTGDGTDPRQFAREVVEYLRSLMLVKLGGEASLFDLPEESLKKMKTQATRTDASAIVRATTLFNNAAVDIKSGLLTIPQLPLELAFVEAAMPVATESPIVEPAAGPASTPKMSTAKAKIPPPPAPPTPPKKVSESAAFTRAEASAPAKDSALSETEITLETVRACFEQVLKDIEEGRTKEGGGKKGTVIAKALRHDTSLDKVSGNTIEFVTSELYKKKFEQSRPKAVINEVFSRVIGQPVAVRFLSKSTVSKTTGTGSNEHVEDENFEALLKEGEKLGGKVVR